MSCLGDTQTLIFLLIYEVEICMIQSATLATGPMPQASEFYPGPVDFWDNCCTCAHIFFNPLSLLYITRLSGAQF